MRGMKAASLANVPMSRMHAVAEVCGKEGDLSALISLAREPADVPHAELARDFFGHAGNHRLVAAFEPAEVGLPRLPGHPEAAARPASAGRLNWMAKACAIASSIFRSA